MDEDADLLPETSDLNKIEEGLYLVDDMENEDLLSNFEEANAFIEDGQEKGSVLVHCFFGVSRSATIVISYLMKKYKLTVDEAFQRAKSKRRFIGPNSGFLKQLLVYQNMHWCVTEDNIQYRLFRLAGAAFSLRSAFLITKDGTVQFREKFQDLVQPDPRTTPSETDPVALRCKRCRSALIRKGSLLPHCQGESPGWSDGKWSGRFEMFSLCAEGIYTLPVTWMGDITSQLQGKLGCPKCQAKLGSYNWISGHQCPCGANIKPAFCFVPSKVDRCL